VAFLSLAQFFTERKEPKKLLLWFLPLREELG